ncbi:MAG: SET domain-containing protein-lysine N-methyltransferase [Pseudobacter sp.]|uniref:SET domain-containing protein-lysine N-methyltransferase n=1 Tax=Pseudobacter sp. TaxID=2045420 RepID=UPI003F7CD97B
MGRGVYTSEPLDEDIIIEVAPVVVMSAEDRIHLDKTLLHDYIFEWGDKGEVIMALGYAPVYNHSYTSNCEYEMDYEASTISIRTVRPIAAGEELFINYNGSWDDDKPLWFDAK